MGEEKVFSEGRIFMYPKEWCSLEVEKTSPSRLFVLLAKFFSLNSKEKRSSKY
jgi:hypothetical protein